MEGRIIIYSQISSKVSNFIYGLVSLIPGAISFNFASECSSDIQNHSVLSYLRSLREYGLPLQIFNSESQLIPLLTLTEVDILDQCKGILAGTTNPLFLNFPKARADMIINLDNEKIEFPMEKQEKSPQSSMIKICRQHTGYEKKLLASIVKQIDVTDEVAQHDKQKQNPKLKQSKGPSGQP